MSVQASVGKPPRQEQPPPSLSASYRKIYVEPEPADFIDVSEKQPITEAEFEKRTGLDIALPSDAMITGVSFVDRSYQIQYSQPSKFGRDYGISELAHKAYEYKPQLGRDFSISDLAHASYELQSQPKYSASRLERDVLAGRYGETGIWQYFQSKVPEGMILTSVGETSKGYELTYTAPVKPAPQYSVSEVWLQGMTAEDIASGLIFRNIWDVKYKKELAQRQTEFRLSHDMPTIQRMQTEQGTIAASVAIIAFSAYDIGRSLYHIAKWGGVRGELSFNPEEMTQQSLDIPDYIKREYGLTGQTPQTEAPFTYTRLTGPKGSRVPETFTFEPKPPEPETFAITSTRGAWSKKPIGLVESEKASATLPQLLLWPSQMEAHVPLGLYEPRFLSEAVFSGMAVGSLLTPASRTEAISRTISIQKPQLGLNASQFSMSGTMQNLEVQQSQAVAQAQSQRLQLKSLQSQRLLTVQKEFGFEPLRKQRRQKGSDLFGLFGRYKREYPILTAKQVMGLKPKKRGLL